MIFSFRIANLGLNGFMKLFQSSWTDIADFRKVFVKIKNTVSGLNHFFLYLYSLFSDTKPSRLLSECKCRQTETHTLLNSLAADSIIPFDRACDAELERGLNVWLSVLERLQSCDDQ